MATNSNLNRTDDSYWDCAWFQKRLNDPLDGRLWERARQICLRSKFSWEECSESTVSDNESVEESALSAEELVEESTGMEDDSIEENINPTEEESVSLDEKSVEESAGTENNSIEDNSDYTEEESTWRRGIDVFIQELFDLIVTCWNPDMMHKKNRRNGNLHHTLKGNGLRSITEIDSSLLKTDDDCDKQTVFEEFESTLTKLHYSEIWTSIVEDFQKSAPDCTSYIKEIYIKPMMTACEQGATARLIGTSYMLCG